MKKTTFENVSGSVLTSTAITATATAAAIGAGPFTTIASALLPALTNSLAHGRFQKRIETELTNLQHQLSEMDGELRDITDNQYKLISELVISVLHSQSDEKIKILKKAVIGGVRIKDIKEHEAFIISRALRDISSVEYEFLNELLNYNEITIFRKDEPDYRPRDKQIVYKADSIQEGLLNSLTQLGLLKMSTSGWGATLYYYVTSTGKRLIEICNA